MHLFQVKVLLGFFVFVPTSTFKNLYCNMYILAGICVVLENIRSNGLQVQTELARSVQKDHGLYVFL